MATSSCRRAENLVALTYLGRKLKRDFWCWYADYPSNWEGTRTASSLVSIQSSPSLSLKRTFMLSSKRVFNSCLDESGEPQRRVEH